MSDNKADLNNDVSEEIFCDVCGMTYKEFLETGKFGCENCYNVFKPHAIEQLKARILKDNIAMKPKNNVVIARHKTKRNKEDIKERIAKLEDLLVQYKEINDEGRIEQIEEEIKKLKEMEIEK